MKYVSNLWHFDECVFNLWHFDEVCPKSVTFWWNTYMYFLNLTFLDICLKSDILMKFGFNLLICDILMKFGFNLWHFDEVWF